MTPWLLALLAAAVPPANPPAAPPRLDAPTPLAERVATLGVLNKRTGETRTLALHPGQMAGAFGLTVIVRSCETTPPWERPRLSGAFVQVDERLLTRSGSTAAPNRIFSGWLYAESPSLNVVESPRYDVWLKSCAMRWPDRKPEAAISPSSAPKSPDTANASRSDTR